MHKRQQRLAYTERRKEVAKLYLEAWTQQAIADHFGVNQSTISRDLEAIRQQWVDSAIKDFNQAKATELARIDKLEREYWSGWERSQDEVKKTSQKAKTQGDNKPNYVEKAQSVEDRVGDPRYLSGVQWCIEQRCKILGIYAPERQDISLDGKVKSITYITENRQQDDA